MQASGVISGSGIVKRDNHAQRKDRSGNRVDSGIGLGIATRLAAEGANIVLNGFGERRDRAAPRELKTKTG